MDRSPVLFAILLAAAAPARGEGSRPPVAAVHAVELPDPAGDVSPIHSTSRDYPGFDVVKLALRSDGRHLTIAATLKDPPGEFASEVVRFYLDTDADASTGAKFIYPKIRGFEYGGDLDACVSYADRSEACAGGSSAKAIGHWSAVELRRYTGKNETETADVVSPMEFPGKKASPRTPIEGTVVQSAIDYADIHVRPGQKMRIVVKESHASSSSEDGGFFPDIVLTLK